MDHLSLLSKEERLEFASYLSSRSIIYKRAVNKFIYHIPESPEEFLSYITYGKAIDHAFSEMAAESPEALEYAMIMFLTMKIKKSNDKKKKESALRRLVLIRLNSVSKNNSKSCGLVLARFAPDFLRDGTEKNGKDRL